MAHLYKKVKKGHEYFYIRETQRVYGKPTTINQVYLGTADKVQSILSKGGFSPKEFGSVFALNELDRSLDLPGIINGILPPKKRTRGPSLGELVFYATLNRAIAPTSKRQLASWYETTDIQRIRPLRLESLNSQNFWNHWDRISDEDLEKIATAFFSQLHSLLPPQERHLVIEAINLSSPPRPGEQEVEGLVDILSAQRLGLALVTEWYKGIPFAFEAFPGGLPGTHLFEHQLDLVAKVSRLGVPIKDVTLLINPDMDAGALAPQIDATQGYHFVAPSSPELAPELMKISLKDFRPLPVKHESLFPKTVKEDEKVLYYETHTPCWGAQRRVIIIFDPKTFHQSYQELGKKVMRVRKEMLALQQKYQNEAGQSDIPGAIKGHLAQLCQRLKILPELFQLTFHQEDGALRMEFQLDHRQIASSVRHFGKTLLITDREDWSAAEIYETCMKRTVLGNQLPGGKAGKETRGPFQVSLMPLYHWTDSKIQVHLFVCIAALAYLTLLCQRLGEADISMTPKEAMEELRALKTAIYASKPEGKLRRLLDKVTENQANILRALGYQVQEGKLLPV